MLALYINVDIVYYCYFCVHYWGTYKSSPPYFVLQSFRQKIHQRAMHKTHKILLNYLWQSLSLFFSLRLKLSTMDVLRNPPHVVCILNGFPNQNCQLMQLHCFLRSPPSVSLSWKVTLLRTWWALSPLNPLMSLCGLKSQVLTPAHPSLYFLLCVCMQTLEPLCRSNISYTVGLKYSYVMCWEVHFVYMII